MATETKELYGRSRIYLEQKISDENVVSVINELLSLHLKNAIDENYLYWYRRGKQPILDRVKEVRPEICNKVVINNADEVVSFKNGYFLTRPATYIGIKKGTSKKVKQYNEYVRLSNKPMEDNRLADWFHTVGVATLYVEPNKASNKDKVPFKCYALDPRYSFVAYDLTPAHEPVVGVNVVISGNYRVIVDVFTKDTYYQLSGKWEGTDTYDRVVSGICVDGLANKSNNNLNAIPIIEYSYNYTRMSAFETAISIMDEINNVESNRCDAIEQQVQQLCVTYNCQFEEGTTANQIRQAGMVQLTSDGDKKADFKILETANDQTGTQVTLDSLYEQMLNKCAMPSTVKGGTSTSDTGTAVYLRDGWGQADCSARNTTDLFKESNARFDEIALTILKMAKGFELDPSEFELKIERNSTSNMISKTQAALNMQSLGLAPQIWLERSGISNDPLTDIEMSEEYLPKPEKAKEVDKNVQVGNEQ